MFIEFTAASALSSQRDSIENIPGRDEDNLCPLFPQLNFRGTHEIVKQGIFWFSIPMLALNFGLMVAMLFYTCTRRTKFCHATWLTKIQFMLLIATSLLSSTL